MLHQRLGIFIEIGSEGNLSLQDVSIDPHRVLIVEGVDTRMHLVDENTEGPPVNSFAVTLVKDNLGSNVFRSPANSEGPAFSEELGKAKVSKLEVAVVADEEIFWFEVPENDVLGVEIFEAGGDDGPVEAGLVGGEGLDVAEVGEEFAAIDEFEDEVEVS